LQAASKKHTNYPDQFEALCETRYRSELPCRRAVVSI